MSAEQPRQLFGTDGIRGRANEYPMTPDVAVQLGRTLAHIFKGQSPRPRIVIGKDTRLSNYMFEAALQAGVCSMGVDAVQLGVLPTPGIAFMTVGLRADAGVVISASHNPYDDNGIKFFGADGFKLPDSLEAKIEGLLGSDAVDSGKAFGASVGRAYRIEDAWGRYCVYLKSTFPKHLSLAGLRIVVDCAHGAGYRVAGEMLYELGAEVILTGNEPNGVNINDGVGALHPEHMTRAVREHSADLGIALDGDADRVLMSDENGRLIDGDCILAILAADQMKKGTLAGGAVVSTVMSNLGLERCLKDRGIRLERTDVGDRYVVARMREGGYRIGGEQSGHVILLDHTTTGDGLLTALQVLAVAVDRDMRLSDLSSLVEPVPQVLRGVRVGTKPSLDTLPAVADAIASAEAQLGDRGRVLVRYSGTEPKCRVMLEGDDETEIDALADQIVAAVTQAIGAAPVAP
jgi:phosphoglucosamine mutase